MKKQALPERDTLIPADLPQIVPSPAKKKCAKWCGGGCTQAQYDAAIVAAKVLSTSLGYGWKPRVWENLGWHYCAVSRNGFVKVHPFFDWRVKKVTSYTAFIGDIVGGGRYTGDGDTPEKAIAAAELEARKDHTAISTWLKDAS